jgi:hypothetical protein
MNEVRFARSVASKEIELVTRGNRGFFGFGLAKKAWFGFGLAIKFSFGFLQSPTH